MADLTRAEIEEYRKKHLMQRGFGNELNELDHRICDMALKGVTYTAPEALRSGETPRTEAMIKSCGDYEKAYHYNGRFAEFARQLERELAEAKKTIIEAADDAAETEQALASAVSPLAEKP